MKESFHYQPDKNFESPKNEPDSSATDTADSPQPALHRPNRTSILLGGALASVIGNAEIGCAPVALQLKPETTTIEAKKENVYKDDVFDMLNVPIGQMLPFDQGKLQKYLLKMHRNYPAQARDAYLKIKHGVDLKNDPGSLSYISRRGGYGPLFSDLNEDTPIKGEATGTKHLAATYALETIGRRLEILNSRCFVNFANKHPSITFIDAVSIADTALNWSDETKTDLFKFNFQYSSSDDEDSSEIALETILENIYNYFNRAQTLELLGPQTRVIVINHVEKSLFTRIIRRDDFKTEAKNWKKIAEQAGVVNFQEFNDDAKGALAAIESISGPTTIIINTHGTKKTVLSYGISIAQIVKKLLHSSHLSEINLLNFACEGTDFNNNLATKIANELSKIRDQKQTPVKTFESNPNFRFVFSAAGSNRLNFSFTNRSIQSSLEELPPHQPITVKNLLRASRTKNVLKWSFPTFHIGYDAGLIRFSAAETSPKNPYLELPPFATKKEPGEDLV